MFLQNIWKPSCRRIWAKKYLSIWILLHRNHIAFSEIVLINNCVHYGFPSSPLYGYWHNMLGAPFALKRQQKFYIFKWWQNKLIPCQRSSFDEVFTKKILFISNVTNGCKKGKKVFYSVFYNGLPLFSIYFPVIFY